jgi:hypothetical protein
MYQPTDWLPCSPVIARIRAAMSLIASSQVTRSNSPGPPVRFNGYTTRSGSLCTSAMAMPLGHA